MSSCDFKVQNPECHVPGATLSKRKVKLGSLGLGSGHIDELVPVHELVGVPSAKPKILNFTSSGLYQNIYTDSDKYMTRCRYSWVECWTRF